MDLLKSYAHQVVSYHPEKARDELFAELYDALCEEFSDWQDQNAQGGEAEFLQASKEHPMRFATRFAPEESAHLIGPQFYYSFISALKMGIMITSGVYLVLAVISALATDAYLDSFLRLLFDLPGTLVWVCVSILGVFIALEKGGAKAGWLDKWNAQDLQRVETHQEIPKGETFFDLGTSTLVLLWLVDIVRFPALIRQDEPWMGNWSVSLPDGFWIAMGALLAFDIVFCIVRLIRVFWSARLRLVTMVANTVWIILLVYAASNPELVSTIDAGPEAREGQLALVNKAVRITLVIICMVLAGESLHHGWRLWKREH